MAKKNPNGLDNLQGHCSCSGLGQTLDHFSAPADGAAQDHAEDHAEDLQRQEGGVVCLIGRDGASPSPRQTPKATARSRKDTDIEIRRPDNRKGGRDSDSDSQQPRQFLREHSG